MSELLRTQCACCGADLCFPKDKDQVRCDACTKWNDRPKAAVEAIGRMKRANELCNAGRFGVAEAIYQRVLEENPDAHEARWGLVRCKYGLIYVMEQRSGKRYPTCRISRLSVTPMRSDYEFTQACLLASEDVRAQYQADAAYFDEARQEILRLMDGEPPYDVFICYKETDDATGGRTKDSVRAQELYQMLKKDGYRIFYAPESLRDKIGANYEAAIYHAIRTAKVMLVVGCRAEHFQATWVRSEWTRFLALREEEPDKRVVPLFEDMTADLLPEEFLNMHLQSVNLGRLGAEMDVREFLERSLGKKKSAAPAAPPPELSDDEMEQAAQLLAAFGLSFDQLIARANQIARTPAGAMKLCLRAGQLMQQKPTPTIAVAPTAPVEVPPAAAESPATAEPPAAVEPPAIPAEEPPATPEPPAEEPSAPVQPEIPADEPPQEPVSVDVSPADEPAPEEIPEEIVEEIPEPEEEAEEEPEDAPAESSEEEEEEEEEPDPAQKAENEELLQLCRKALEQAKKNFTPRDPVPYDEIFKELHRKAESGDARAMYEVSKCYDYGRGVRRNKDKSKEWLKKAAEAGDPEAMCILSKSDDDWISRAIEKYRSMAEAGDPVGMMGIVDWSEDAEERRFWSVAALKIYLDRAAKGDAGAQYEVARSLEGLGPLEDAEMSLEWELLAAGQGHFEAMKNIASSYSWARDSRCIEWYEKLGRTKDIDSLITLGNLYRTGKEYDWSDTTILDKDELDPTRAAQCFRTAILLGEDWYAPFNLAEMYEKGEGVEKDFSRALAYYTRLREDYPHRSAHLQHIDGLIAFYEKKDYKTAAACFFDLNKDGSLKSDTHHCGGDGWYAGAWLLEHGEGVQRDLEKAKTFYRLAEDFDESHREQAQEGLRRIEQTIRQEKEAAQLAEERAKDPKWREICSLKNAAEKGDVTAMCRLALIYGDLKNGNPWLSLDEYDRWFEKAVATGNAAVLRETAWQIEEQMLSLSDWDWMEAAAKLGDDEAQYEVAMSHYNDEDPAVCIEWLTKAAEQGHVEAIEELAAKLDRVGHAEAAFKWYLKAAENGNDWAQYRVGVMYHASAVVKKDCKTALKWLKEAADNGSDYAREYLKEHLKFGRLW